MTDTRQLLSEYAQNGSETAFRELVTRYIDLVFSTAVRLVNGDTHRAQDVTQTVFAGLAKKAATLSPDVMLGGWLHRHTVYVASNTMRGERRRLERERQAVEMNAIEDHSSANLALIAPTLDEAIDQLASDDRDAILLRYFEQKDFQSVGATLGSSEEAARKRVDRALEKLHALLKRRGVTLSATVLATTMATQAVTAAPAGLAITVSTAALATAAVGGGATLTILKIMSMTKLQVGIASAILVVGVAIPSMMQRQTRARLDETNASLQKQIEHNSQLAADNERLSKLVASAAQSRPASNNASLETLKLRGEVGRLRQEGATDREVAAAARTNSPISGLTSDPDTYKLIRDQQKMGMTMIYKNFGTRLKLSTEKNDQLADILADGVMENIDNVTAGIRDGKSIAQLDQMFRAHEAEVQQKIEELLGPEALTQYKDYNKNLVSLLSSEQFKDQFDGDKDAKAAKGRQLYQLMQDERERVLAAAGLPSNYQLVPTLNFLNFASESETDKNLRLLDDVFGNVIAKADSFMTPEEIAKLSTFRSNAMRMNRMSITVNRKMMSPAAR